MVRIEDLRRINLLKDMPENLLALLLCLIVLAVLILTADSTPRFIYQGF